mgnify:CR=1 FL=1
MYAKTADSPKVFLVYGYLESSFNRTPFDLRDKKILTFEGVGREQLKGLGDVRTPAIADLFVAKVKGAAA